MAGFLQSAGVYTGGDTMPLPPAFAYAQAAARPWLDQPVRGPFPIPTPSSSSGNLYTSIPVPGGTGVGDWVSVAGSGRRKYLLITGCTTGTGNFSIEASMDGVHAGPALWKDPTSGRVRPASFSSPLSASISIDGVSGTMELEIVCQYLRIRREGTGGSVYVDVGAENALAS